MRTGKVRQLRPGGWIIKLKVPRDAAVRSRSTSTDVTPLFTRLRFGSALLRNARLAAPASVIPNKSHNCEQDSEHGQGRCCYLNAAHYDRHPSLAYSWKQGEQLNNV